LAEVIFELGRNLKEITGFHRCTSLSRIALPPSVQSLTCPSVPSGKPLRGFHLCLSLRTVEIAKGSILANHSGLHTLECFVNHADEDLKLKRHQLDFPLWWSP
jgi:hypothetical protein